MTKVTKQINNEIDASSSDAADNSSVSQDSEDDEEEEEDVDEQDYSEHYDCEVSQHQSLSKIQSLTVNCL